MMTNFTLEKAIAIAKVFGYNPENEVDNIFDHHRITDDDPKNYLDVAAKYDKFLLFKTLVINLYSNTFSVMSRWKSYCSDWFYYTVYHDEDLKKMVKNNLSERSANIRNNRFSLHMKNAIKKVNELNELLKEKNKIIEHYESKNNYIITELDIINQLVQNKKQIRVFAP